MAKVLVINGPNLNMLGKRETDVYGSETLEDINEKIAKEATNYGHNVDFFQSNDEGQIVDKIHEAVDYDVLIINPAALTHYSIALRDAVTSIKTPVIEVHISNIFAREEFRHKSVISPVVKGIISGFGPESYVLAVRAVDSLPASSK